ncbi:hypothetical protein I5M27_10325 [Adhaeribacter sp. BT258]|uniref:DUF6268 domain-containing protein n=1 Tax=Adhaeribacter terrigena TaxID=2793070 RepID=A0ABS1C1X3_9BACT|nr:DUF6268 family outer membrane beta-barrel protein [Adhaeribacter terrigena]MBK0403382.1 hypothetical protein [Adhaeribacter terrigena]
MKIFYSTLFTFLALLSSLGAQAQDAAQDTSRQDKEYANPSVEGTPRGRFFLLRYQRLFSHDFNSTGDWKNLPVSKDARINTNNVAEIKGFIPIWNNPHFKAVLGVGYEREEFNFEDSHELAYLYHENLQDKGLKSLSAQIATVKPLNYKNYLVMRVKGALNGDYTSDELNFNDYLKLTAEALYGWKKNKYFTWGIGAQAGYTFGRYSIYPAILYNRTFNDRWGIEAVFPANVKVRRTFSEKSYLYFGYNLDGYSYNIKVQKPPFYNSPVFGDIKTIELRHNDVRAQLRWEKEIYDFLWFSLEGGYRYNIAFDAFRTGSDRDDRLISTNLGGAPYAAVDLYFVVPRAFLKR